MIELILHGESPKRVLVGANKADGFTPCQEDRKKQKMPDGSYVDDTVRFQEIMNSSEYNVTLFEDTQEYADAVSERERLEKVSQIQSLEQQALRSLIAVTLDPSNTTERGYLQGYKDQIDTIRVTL